MPNRHSDVAERMVQLGSAARRHRGRIYLPGQGYGTHATLFANCHAINADWLDSRPLRP